MKLTPEQVDHIATLARLDVSAEERELFGRQLSSILDYVGMLSKARTAGVEPMNHIVEIHNVLGDDEVVACDPAVRDALIEAFPERQEDLLRVKAVFS